MAHLFDKRFVERANVALLLVLLSGSLAASSWSAVLRHRSLA